MLVIDGSHGEGGGQVLRTSLALSAITGQPVRVEHIRAARRTPGLRPQHLTAARAAAAICNARLEGDEIGSQALTFEPRTKTQPGKHLFDVSESARGGSAGSVGLVLQTVLPPLLLADGTSTVTVRGGTHVPWAPSASYLTEVYLRALARMGSGVCAQLVRWGFYPAGGGEVRAEVLASKRPLHALVLTERGPLQEAYGTAVAMNLPASIPQRMSGRARNVLAQSGIAARVEPLRVRGAGPGAGISLFARYANAVAGFTAYGRKGLPSEQVADTACREFMAHHNSGAPVDPYLVDQLVLPMALAHGRSELVTSQVSQHLRTSVWVVKQFLTLEAVITPATGGGGRLVVEGMGL
jgi:RNA 3'-terminal phosphate cyclase (ATP)